MSAKSEPTAKEKSANQAAEKKTLDLALSAINKQYGDGTLMRMGDATKMQVSSVSTGSVAIDLALGVGRTIRPVPHLPWRTTRDGWHGRYGHVRVCRDGRGNTHQNAAY